MANNDKDDKKVDESPKAPRGKGEEKVASPDAKKAAEPSQEDALSREERNEELLKVQLKQVQDEKEQWMNKYYTELADVQNLRKDIQRDNEVLLKYRAEPFVERLIPFFNSFDMAFRSEPKDDAAKGWVSGMHMIYKQLMSALAEEGVTVIDPKVGERFDPHTMESVQGFEDDKPDLVHAVLMKGYMLKDRVLAPASVVVTIPKKPVLQPQEGAAAEDKGLGGKTACKAQADGDANKDEKK